MFIARGRLGFSVGRSFQAVAGNGVGVQCFRFERDVQLPGGSVPVSPVDDFVDDARGGVVAGGLFCGELVMRLPTAYLFVASVS